MVGVVKLCNAANNSTSEPDIGSYSSDDSWYDKCYSCEYTVLASENHHEGTKECMDPFNHWFAYVPTIECRSGTCAVSYEFKRAGVALLGGGPKP